MARISGEEGYRFRGEREALAGEVASLLHAGPEPDRDLLAGHGQDGAPIHLPDQEVDGVRSHVNDRVPAQPRPSHDAP